MFSRERKKLALRDESWRTREEVDFGYSVGCAEQKAWKYGPPPGSTTAAVRVSASTAAMEQNGESLWNENAMTVLHTKQNSSRRPMLWSGGSEFPTLLIILLEKCHLHLSNAYYSLSMALKMDSTKRRTICQSTAVRVGERNMAAIIRDSLFLNASCWITR